MCGNSLLELSYKVVIWDIVEIHLMLMVMTVTEDMFQERILHSLMDQADSKEQDILRMVENSMYLLIIMMDHLRKRIQVVILESDR